MRDGGLQCHVLGNVAPRGICGSGLVDAVAAGLELGWISSKGRLANGDSLALAGPVSLNQWDVRELQLAKGAIAAGLRILLEQWGATKDDLGQVFLAGAFGNYINHTSARRIGLLDFAAEKVRPAGNTALLGAKLALFSLPEHDGAYPEILGKVKHVSLNEDARFQETFVEEMVFPEGEAYGAGAGSGRGLTRGDRLSARAASLPAGRPARPVAGPPSSMARLRPAFFVREDGPATVALLQVGFDGLAVILHEPDELLRDAQAEQPQLAQRVVERLGLPHGVPFADDRLQGRPRRATAGRWRRCELARRSGSPDRASASFPPATRFAPRRARWPAPGTGPTIFRHPAAARRRHERRAGKRTANCSAAATGPASPAGRRAHPANGAARPRTIGRCRNKGRPLSPDNSSSAGQLRSSKVKGGRPRNFFCACSRRVSFRALKSVALKLTPFAVARGGGRMISTSLEASSSCEKPSISQSGISAARACGGAVRQLEQQDLHHDAHIAGPLHHVRENPPGIASGP